jgi:hypothetical protein
MASYPATNEQEHKRLTPAVQALIAINVVMAFLQAVDLLPRATSVAWLSTSLMSSR